MPKPADGRYRLTTTSPPGASSIVEVSGMTMYTSFGPFQYSPPGDLFFLGSIGVECLGDGTFRAVWGTGNYTGTCVKL